MPGAAVADEADGVDGLAGAAGGDEHAQSAQVALALHLQAQLHLGHDTVGIGHAPGAVHAAGQLARARLDHEHAPLPQERHVALRGRVFPHVGVHSRRHHDGLGEGQTHGGQEVVGDAVGHLGQRVGRRGSDDHDVGFPAVLDVGDAGIGAQLVDVVEPAGMPGEGLEGHGRHELRGGRGHDDPHLHACLLQEAQQLGGLVGRDPSRHP